MSEPLKSLTGEQIDSATITGDRSMIRCSNVLDNKMQCPRPAQLARHDDPDNREALCGVCYAFKNMPSGYDRQVGRVINVKHSGT